MNSFFLILFFFYDGFSEKHHTHIKKKKTGLSNKQVKKNFILIHNFLDFISYILYYIKEVKIGG